MKASELFDKEELERIRELYRLFKGKVIGYKINNKLYGKYYQWKK